MSQNIPNHLHYEIYQSLQHVVPADAVRQALVEDEAARLVICGRNPEEVEAYAARVRELGPEALVATAFEMCITNDRFDGDGNVGIDRDGKISFQTRDLYRQFLLNSVCSALTTAAGRELEEPELKLVRDGVDRLKSQGRVTISVDSIGHELVLSREDCSVSGVTLGTPITLPHYRDIETSLIQFVEQYLPANTNEVDNSPGVSV